MMRCLENGRDPLRDKSVPVSRVGGMSGVIAAGCWQNGGDGRMRPSEEVLKDVSVSAVGSMAVMVDSRIWVQSERCLR